MSLGKILKDVTTDEYGVSFDTVNLCAVIGFGMWAVFEAVAFFHGKQFDGTAFGLSFAGIMATIAGAQRAKPAAVPPADGGAQS